MSQHIPTVEARLATAADLPALEANETEATRGLSATYLQAQDEGDVYVVVGLLDGEVKGRALLDCRDRDDVLTPELKVLWVVPEARRHGVGAAITAEVERQARALGYDAIFLGVTPDNPAAIPLYIGMEYLPTGEHRNAVNQSVLDPDDLDTTDPTEAIYRKSLRAA